MDTIRVRLRVRITVYLLHDWGIGDQYTHVTTCGARVKIRAGVRVGVRCKVSITHTRS